MGGIVKRYSKRINQDRIEILKKIEESEGFLKAVYKQITEDFRNVIKKAEGNRMATAVSDLEKFVKDIKDLRKITPHENRRKELENLISRTNLFIETYKQNVRAGLFETNQEKFNSLIVSMRNALKDTVLKELEDEYRTLKDLEKKIQIGK